VCKYEIKLYCFIFILLNNMSIHLLYINYLLFHLQVCLIYSHFFKLNPLLNNTNLLVLQNKNKYKLDKICDVVNMSRLDNDTITQYTYFKYYYDFFRPYRRVCDLNRLVHFNKLEAVKKACLVCKILFYAFYYSI
jgi:hypothetical protein